MRVKAQINMQQLARSLKTMAKKYGDDQDQAVSRLAVSVGRQMAIETQAFGVNSRKKQEGAIEAGMRVACWVMENAAFKEIAKNPEKARGIIVVSVSELDEKLEKLRDKKGHVKAQPQGQKLIVSKSVFNQCLKLRKKRAGKAKGAWLGAGEKAAGKQKGNNKITIGKNFMSYAQKFAHRGNARFSGGLLSSKTCTLENTYPYTKLKRVVSDAARNNSLQIATEKTLKWYKKANKENALK